MLKYMLKPFFKRFFGLFLSMIVVGTLAVSMLSAFGSSVVNLREKYDQYEIDYGNFNIQVSTNFIDRKHINDLKTLEGVEGVESRFTIDAYFKKADGRTIITRIFSYNENDKILKRYVVSSVDKNPNYINIGIAQKFANNNSIKVGDVVKIGYFGLFLDFYVNEIVETIEGIYPRANDYIWSDNTDFGYMYLSEQSLGDGLDLLAKEVRELLDNDPDFKEKYDSIVSIPGIVFPIITNFAKEYVFDHANQIVIKSAPGTNEEEVVKRVQEKLESNTDVKVSKTQTSSQFPYKVYMNSAMRQITIASVFLTVFFYAITMIVVGLFMNQMIKAMTSQIGVLMSIGIDSKEIMSLYVIFAVLMSISSAIIGVPIGYWMNTMLTEIMKRTYSLPVLNADLHVGIEFLAIFGLLLFSVIATLISCKSILRITPKDATISNEAKRKPIPKWIEKWIEGAPMSIKLGVNSIAQNPRRAFASAFSIFASLTLIILSSFFYVSKTEMVDQSVNRRLNYDCQVYLTAKADPKFVEGLKSQSFIKKDSNGNPMFEDCYYTYTKAEVGDKSVYLECLAYDYNSNLGLVSIPSKDGLKTTKISDKGIVLTTNNVNNLGVGKGGNVTINGKQVLVSEESNQYFHPITYLSKAQMDELGIEYVSSFLLNISDENAFLNYISENENQCLIVFTRSLERDLRSIFNSIDIFIYIMIIFSLAISFAILSIMNQNALMEMQRQLSVMRAIGFKVSDISAFWTLQTVLQTLSGAVIAVPAGCFFSNMLFNMASSNNQKYPFVFSWPYLWLAILFITVVIVLCHLFAMNTIRKWNIADNTRSRE